MLGHLPEILVVVLVGLLVFGPKRVIEMGSQLGKVVRELRESTKDLRWSALMSSDEPPQQTTFSKLSQLSQTLSANGQPADVAAPSPNGATVEGTVEHHEDVAN